PAAEDAAYDRAEAQRGLRRSREAAGDRAALPRSRLGTVRAWPGGNGGLRAGGGGAVEEGDPDRGHPAGLTHEADSTRVPHAVQRHQRVHARLRRAMAVHRRCGTVRNAESWAVPGLQRTTTCCAAPGTQWHVSNAE